MANVERVKMLIDALKSGKYKMTKGNLRRELFEEDGGGEVFCALGVACDVYSMADENVGCKWDHGIFCTKRNIRSFMGFPPIEVREWYGLSTKQAEKIAKANDDYCDSLDCVADYIQKNILEPEKNENI